MKKIYKRKSLRRLAAVVCAALTAGTLGFVPVLYANPVLDSKDGAVSISGLNTANVNITSGATDNLIKWVDFSIGKNEKVAFDGKNYLNYVTGSARSDILGTLTGGGSIYLVNPNGILIGDGAIVDVGSLHLSTKNLDVSQLTDYDKGLNLLTSATVAGDVINMGKLNADVISVEGNNITFKNAADVTSGATLEAGALTGGTLNNNVTLTAGGNGEIHIGMAAGPEATAVNDTQYKDVNLSVPTGWTINKNANDAMYMLVRNGYELQNMQNNLSGKYMLAGDINASSINGFTPIGKDYDNAFTGRFDGLDYKLTGLKVTEPGNGFCGLFGQNNGTIENLEIGGITVVSNSYNEHYIGTVAGDNNNNGTIRNVRNTGDIDINFAYNDRSISIAYIGGIVARNYGTIQNAYNSGEISVDNAVDMGGIAGYNDGTIASVFNSGNLTGNCGEENYMGGIAGFQYGTITDAYNSGAITNKRGDGYTGGIVGSNCGTVNRTYNRGTLTGGANLGGIAGGGWGSVENSYYLDTIEPAGAGSSKGTAKSADELRQAETFASWGSDISAVGSKNATWRIYEGNSNPLLTAFMTAKDNYQGTPVYNGEETGDVGANYRDSTYSGTAEQIGGINYVNDYTIVTPKALTVTNVNKTYDGTDTATIKAANLSGVVTGDTLTVSTTSANYADKNAATGKTVTYGGLTLSGAKAKNYTIDASGTTTGNISPKEITATFADIAKTYDGTTNATAGQGTLTGVEAIDEGKVSVSGLAAYDTKNAGSRRVDYTNVALSGAEAANYTIANTATGSGTITAKELSATFADISKTYDGTTNATVGAGTLTGVVAGDTGKVSVSGLAAYDTKNAGTRTVNYTNVALSGAEAANYTIADTATGSGTISKADVKISVDNYSRAYDGTTDASGATLKTVDGTIFAGDTLSGGTLAFTDKNAGTGKTITVSDVTVNDGNGGNNYNVTYQEGTGEITRRPLSLTANPVSITQGEAVPASFSGTLTGFAEGESLAEGDSYAFNLSGTPTAVGKYAITGTLSIGGGDPAESGDYGTNYTFANAATNATAFTIAAKYVPPAPTPTPSAPSGGNGGNTGNTGGNTGSTTPTNPTTPTVPTPIAPSGNTDSTTPNSGGNTSGTGANPPTPLAAAEPVIVATVTETETIAAAATAGATAEMSHIADNVSPTSLTEQPANSDENAAAAPLAAASETGANAQGFTLTAGGLLAISNETNSAPKDAMSVESIGHALSTLQHGSGEKSAATAPNTETKSAAGSIGSLEEAVEATDLAIGTEIAETDRESNAGQENLASDTGTAGGTDESAEESDEKKKQKQQ